MATRKCHYLERDRGENVCVVTGVRMKDNDPKVNHLCDTYDYENCPVYKDARREKY